MMKKFIFLPILISFFLLSLSSAYAAKKYVPKNSTSTTNTTKSASSYLPAIVKYRTDKLGIYLSFSNFKGLETVNYSFTYNSNGIPQGAGGTIRTSNNPSAQRELLFGTCSRGVCTYHYNLTNAKLVLNAKYLNGRTYTKVYKIKTYQ